MNKKQETNGNPVPEVKESAFPKEQIIHSRRYAWRKDALRFLLEDGKDYTFTEVDTILNDYMKGQVK